MTLSKWYGLWGTEKIMGFCYFLEGTKSVDAEKYGLQKSMGYYGYGLFQSQLYAMYACNFFLMSCRNTDICVETDCSSDMDQLPDLYCIQQQLPSTAKCSNISICFKLLPVAPYKLPRCSDSFLIAAYSCLYYMCLGSDSGSKNCPNVWPF